MNDEYIEVNGEVLISLPNAMFKVKLANKDGKFTDEGIVITCHVSGKIRKNSINILPGDHVIVAISKYDITKGRIVYRIPK